MKVLVTGASGFVGRHVCADLRARGHDVRAAVRSPEAAARVPEGVPAIPVGDVGPGTDWGPALEGAEAVVHAAGLAHVLAGAPAEAYRRVNALGTLRLARQAAEGGVRRLVFLSTLKVHAGCGGDRAVRATDPYRPDDAYAISKVEAEEALLGGAAGPGLSVAVVRPPLVYGPGVKANFRRLLELVARGFPLPLASVRNRRSLVSLWNLCDLVARLAVAPEAGGRAWLVSDGEDVSTPELLRRIGDAMERPARLFPFPVPALGTLLRAAGRGAEFERLAGSLFVDVESTRRELSWSPPITLDEGLRRTVQAFAGGTP